MYTTALTSSATAPGAQFMARDLKAMGRGTDLFLVLIIVLILAWIFVCSSECSSRWTTHLLTTHKQVLLRAYVRYHMIRNIAADDWWMFASIVRGFQPWCSCLHSY